jgi:hypothetical protein
MSLSMPNGLAAFCARRQVDTALWAERGKLRLNIDATSISIDSPADTSLRLSTRLKPLPADSLERGRLLDLLMLRVTGRALESAEAIVIRDADMLCVERRLDDAQDEFAVSRAIEEFANAVVYWRGVMRP